MSKRPSPLLSSVFQQQMLQVVRANGGSKCCRWERCVFELNISTGSTDTVTCNTGRTGPDTATICSTGTVTSAFLGLSIFICVFYLRGSTDAGLQEKQLFTKLGKSVNHS